MNSAAVLCVALLLGGGHAIAQTATPAEITFWESVRNSKNPAELQAYLQTFPNGVFAPLARARIAALEKPALSRPAVAPAQPTTAPRPASFQARLPQPGDTWTYRLSFPKVLGTPDQPPRTYEVKVNAVGGGKIIDHLSIDGGSPLEMAMPGGTYVVPQGVSIFSPYLAAFPRNGRLTRPEILDPPCKAVYFCEASARVIGTEVLDTPAGKFTTTKVLIQESWRPSSGTAGHPTHLGQMIGGRTLTVWYAPEVGRAVKFESRLTVGDVPPIDANFDLELVSYQVK